MPSAEAVRTFSVPSSEAVANLRSEQAKETTLTPSLWAWMSCSRNKLVSCCERRTGPAPTRLHALTSSRFGFQYLTRPRASADVIQLSLCVKRIALTADSCACALTESGLCLLCDQQQQQQQRAQARLQHRLKLEAGPIPEAEAARGCASEQPAAFWRPRQGVQSPSRLPRLRGLSSAIQICSPQLLPGPPCSGCRGRTWCSTH